MSAVTALGMPAALATHSAQSWYRADGNVVDSISSFHGAAGSGVGYAAGSSAAPSDQALAFSPGNAGVVIPAGAADFGPHDFTISFEIKTTATASGALLSKRSACAHTAFWSIRMSSGRLFVEVDQDALATNYQTIATRSSINDGAWHSVRLRRVGATLLFVIDGVLDNSVAFPGRGAVDLSNAASTPVRMGEDVCGFHVAQDPFVGMLDNVRFLNDAPPLVTDVSGPAAPIAIDSPAAVTATFTDPTAGDSHSCTIDFGDGARDAGVVADGTCTATHTYDAAGVYPVLATLTDMNGDSGSAVYEYVVVYDPNGGFVTGGGWIDSPPSAYTPDITSDDDVVGRASFGFVSKYLKGASVPTGTTEFQFQAGNLRFKSAVYQWLIVGGPKAQFMGSGTVNGSSEAQFLLTANDGQVTGGGGVDRFRIKIWTESGVIYDNQGAATSSADALDAIEGGSIVIHTKK